jgi:acyl carrier protein
MGVGSEQHMSIQDVVIQALSAVKDLGVVSIASDEDVFSKFALNSMEIFSVLVKLENTFDIVIGEDPSEFDRIRSFAGLIELLQEKVHATAPASEAGRPSA